MAQVGQARAADLVLLVPKPYREQPGLVIGEPLMLIVPKGDALTVEARIAPQEIDQIWSGLVTTEFDHVNEGKSASERDVLFPLLEVYTPIHAVSTGEVIAVAEFYERAEEIHEQFTRAIWQSWLITALLAVAIMGALFSIVANGSRTIERQRVALTRWISELSALLHQNQTLRDRVERGAREATEDSERFLRQIGSDLHDGSAQLVRLALLRLDSLQSATLDDDPALIRRALSDALEEIRNICAGLLLPETQDRNLKEALLLTIRHHERRTGTSVAFGCGDLRANPPRCVKFAYAGSFRRGSPTPSGMQGARVSWSRRCRTA
jgi:signal transduction histidine kinase